jgi:hypothetical protein
VTPILRPDFEAAGLIETRIPAYRFAVATGLATPGDINHSDPRILPDFKPTTSVGLSVTTLVCLQHLVLELRHTSKPVITGPVTVWRMVANF